MAPITRRPWRYILQIDVKAVFDDVPHIGEQEKVLNKK